MIDKEKVLHGLSSCGTDHGIPNICEVTECPYREDKAWCVHGLAHDAGMLIAELLKAQEPVEPRKRVNHNGFEYYHCGACDAVLMAFQPKYCHKCGREVKWDA